MKLSFVFVIFAVFSQSALAASVDAFSITFKARLDHVMFLVDRDGTQSAYWHASSASQNNNPYGVRVGQIVSEQILVSRTSAGYQMRCAKVLACGGVYGGPTVLADEYNLADGRIVNTMFQLASGKIYEDWYVPKQNLMDGTENGATFSRVFSHWSFWGIAVMPVGLEQQQPSLAAEVPLPKAFPLLAFSLVMVGAISRLKRPKNRALGS